MQKETYISYKWPQLGQLFIQPFNLTRHMKLNKDKKAHQDLSMNSNTKSLNTSTCLRVHRKLKDRFIFLPHVASEQK